MSLARQSHFQKIAVWDSELIPYLLNGFNRIRLLSGKEIAGISWPQN